MSTDPNPVQPALDAIRELRIDVKKRIGKEGGHLNKEMLQKITTIESTLLQIPSVHSMVNVINQQAQLMTFTIRNMSRAAGSELKQLENGDDGTSDTKGE